MITYLIGAGASCEVLPLVINMQGELKKIIDLLNEPRFALSNDPPLFGQNTTLPRGREDVRKRLIEDLQWLHDEISNHASVDTFANKLYIKNDENLTRLKITLSAFIILIQCNNKYDKRYDTFFASILKENAINLPKNIKIISWNYDYQFEKAFREYLNRSIGDITHLLNVMLPRHLTLDTSGFSIFKLNGSTDVISTNGGHITPWIDFFETEMSKAVLEKILFHYYQLSYRNQWETGVSFAWEKSNNGIVHITTQAAAKTEILVIIGYSFPYFNREVDRSIIKGMASLKKVYFQAPDGVRPDLEDKNLIVHNDWKQFLLPDELE